MSLSSFIADMRRAVARDPATAQVFYAALGTLVGVAEAEALTGPSSRTAAEPPAPGEPVRLPAPYRARWNR
jgi:hypothetical protein